MNYLLWFLRSLADLKFKLFGLAIIQKIPTDQFNSLLQQYIDAGWEKTYLYEGIDAWIDYGRADLRKKSIKLRFEWDNWMEGEISGPHALVEEIAKSNGLLALRKRKWWKTSGGK